MVGFGVLALTIVVFLGSYKLFSLMAAWKKGLGGVAGSVLPEAFPLRASLLISILFIVFAVVGLMKQK